MMNTASVIITEENGFALVTAMILLVVLTVIGIAATQTSMFEIMISGAERRKNAAFYAAEAGLEHGKMVVGPLISTNIGAAADPTVQKPELTFLLDGSSDGWDAATTDEEGNTTFEVGARTAALENQPIGDGYTYSVRIYDNRSDSDMSPTVDGDGMVILSSQASKPNGGVSRLEIGYETSISLFREEDYEAEGGREKGHSNTDSGVAEFRKDNDANEAVGQFQMGAYNHD
jgi:type IV pilus assembly protein PilX